MLEPEGGPVDAEAQGAGAMFVFLEAVDDGEIGDGASLACLVDDLGDIRSVHTPTSDKPRNSHKPGTPIVAADGVEGGR